MKNKTILIVDDNRFNRRILSGILEYDGYKTAEASNGKEALEILTDKKLDISLVLLDLSMPVMNGFELLEAMNERGIISSVPVIVTTGNEESDVEIKSLDCGASDFLTKPYNAELVRHRVKSMLRLFENASIINQLKTDRLTDMYSPEFFYHYVKAQLLGNPDEKYEIICSDIENFKIVNAKYGTASGDKMLQFVADTHRKYFGEQAILGRLGGDVFAIFRKREPLHSQEEIGRLFKEKYKESPITNVVLKYGVYPIENIKLAVSEMCDCAKLAVSSIKNKFGIYYAVYNEAMRAALLREHQLSNYMEQALKEKQFLVYFQPKHDTETGEIMGAEALVRWVHPELGFISPGEFIPLFEKNGFVRKLDNYVLAEVCCVLKKWIDAGIEPIPVSVNLSRVDFVNEQLAERIEDLISEYKIPHKYIHFEVTESAYTDNPQQIIATVSSLRYMGFKIEMDDFGSGYSSLNMLSELPIDILKLDMRFMQKSDGSVAGGKRSILSFIISLSKWLQLPTVAEGVETETEVELLKSMGCDSIQGYFFSKPMPIVDFVEYMKNCREKDVNLTSQKMKTQLAGHGGNNQPHVLVCSDTIESGEKLKDMLEPFYRVSMAWDSEMFFKLIGEFHSEFSCVLLDISLPVRKDESVIELLKNEVRHEKVPVIIIAEAEKENEIKKLELISEMFIKKPCNQNMLLNHVAAFVSEMQYKRINEKLMEENRSLMKMAYFDEMTGLSNRFGLMKYFDDYVSEKPFSIIMADVDCLKSINDLYGHVTGDKIIKIVSDVLRSNIGSGDLVARVGGDEFFVVLSGVSDKKDASKAAEKICRDISAVQLPKGVHISLSCSAGVLTLTGKEDIYSIYNSVDKALYEAKQKNKGSFAIYNEKTMLKKI